MIKRILILAGAPPLLAVAVQAQSSYFDDFDREDSMDPGPGWNERVGDWEIHEGLLRPNQEDDTLEKLISYDDVTIDRAFTIEAEIDWSVRSQWNGLIWNIQDEENYYLFRVRADNGRVQAMKFINGAFDPVYVNLGDDTVELEEDTFYRLAVEGDGRGNFWWSVNDGDETLAGGSFSDDDVFAPGPAGLYTGSESIEVATFRVETFDLETEASDLRIHTAVEIEFDTTPGFHYQVETSPDMEEWEPVGAPISGDGENVSMLFSARDQERRFFRVMTSAEE